MATEHDIKALEFLSRELFKKSYDELSESEEQEVEAEMKYRDSLGWRS